MQIQTNSTGNNAAGTSSSANGNAASTDGQFAELLGDSDPETMLHDITKDGMNSMWKWQVKELRKKIAEKVMQQMNITKDDIAKMSPELRMDTEKKIMEEVERQVRLMLANVEDKKKNASLLGASIADNGKLDGATAQSLLSLTQEYNGA